MITPSRYPAHLQPRRWASQQPLCDVRVRFINHREHIHSCHMPSGLNNRKGPTMLPYLPADEALGL